MIVVHSGQQFHQTFSIISTIGFMKANYLSFTPHLYSSTETNSIKKLHVNNFFFWLQEFNSKVLFQQAFHFITQSPSRRLHKIGDSILSSWGCKGVVEVKEGNWVCVDSPNLITLLPYLFLKLCLSQPLTSPACKLSQNTWSCIFKKQARYRTKVHRETVSILKTDHRIK